MPPRTRVVVGAIFVVTTVLVIWATESWLTTRLFEPVNLPISLRTARIETNFQINLREDYRMLIDLDDSTDDWASEEAGTCNRYRLGEVNWRVFRLRSLQRNEELWAERETPNPVKIFWGGFHAIPGEYRIELEIPASTMCLSARHPHLIVYTDNSFYREMCGWIELFCFLIGSSGAMLALRGVWQLLLGLVVRKNALRMCPAISLRNVVPLARHRPMGTISGFTNLTVAWIGVLCALTIIFYYFLTQPLHLQGLSVDFKGQDGASIAHSPWTETLGVYIKEQGRFYVNGKLVEKEKLCEKLREELGKRAVWTVYVEADSNANFQEAVYAMDTITGLGGKVIWITPMTRKEWAQKQK